MSDWGIEREKVLRKWVLSAAMSERPGSAALSAEEVGATRDDLEAVVKYLVGKRLIERKQTVFFLARGVDLSKTPDALVEITSEGVDRVFDGEIFNTDNLLDEVSPDILDKIDKAAKSNGFLDGFKQGVGSSLGEALIKTAPKLAFRFFTAWGKSGNVHNALMEAAAWGGE